MTEIILTFPVLTFPVQHAIRLSCVWIETGNPARPMVCRWIARAITDVDPGVVEITEVSKSRLCA